QAYVLGNPKAWLGTAYHEVLEALPSLVSEASELPFGERVEVSWNNAIARLARAAASHPLNHRFGEATTWRGYYLVLETLAIRTFELPEQVGPPQQQAKTQGKRSRILHEQEFTALSGALRGRIDLMRGDEIVDYKTGALFENSGVDDIPSVKDAY